MLIVRVDLDRGQWAEVFVREEGFQVRFPVHLAR